MQESEDMRGHSQSIDQSVNCREFRVINQNNKPPKGYQEQISEDESDEPDT